MDNSRVNNGAPGYASHRTPLHTAPHTTSLSQLPGSSVYNRQCISTSSSPAVSPTPASTTHATPLYLQATPSMTHNAGVTHSPTGSHYSSSSSPCSPTSGGSETCSPTALVHMGSRLDHPHSTPATQFTYAPVNYVSQTPPPSQSNPLPSAWRPW